MTLHFAQSLDGRIGFPRGHRRAVLSAPEGIVHAHRARAEHDAVLVGIGTVLCDDPRLTVREVAGPQPRRVVLDSALRLPDAARVLDGEGSLWVFGAEGRATAHDQERLEARGAEVVCVAAAGGQLSLRAVLATLEARGIRRLLVEGGAAVLTSFLRERLADAAEIDVAPCFLGAPAVHGVADLGVGDACCAIALDRLRVDRLGPNLLLSGAISYGAQPPEHPPSDRLDHVQIPTSTQEAS